MKRSTKFALATVAALGVAALAVPVVAQQGHMQHGGMMEGGMGMMRQHGGMMMGGGQNYAMATFDTNKDGTLSPEEMTAGIQAELKTYDADANDSLSLEEFAAMHAAHTRKMMVRAFQMHDADGDAQVTEGEMITMMDLMQSKMDGQQDSTHGMSHGTMGNN